MTEILKHDLIPKHSVLSDSEKQELLKKYPIESLPKILRKDPAIASLNLEVGTIVKIERYFRDFKDVYYRVVVNG